MIVRLTNIQAVNFSDTVTFVVPVVLPVGAVGAPSFGFVGDLTTGIYRVGAGQIGVAIAGALKATFTATGARFGDTAAPTVSLEAANGLTVASGNLTMTTGEIFTAGSIKFTSGGPGIISHYANDTVVKFFAWDTDVNSFEVARIESDTHSRFCHTRPVNLLGAAASELTIATGVITITAGFHTVETESGDATDDLATISGGRTGDILVITPADDAHTVVVKDGANLSLSGGGDFTMDEDEDFLVLILVGSVWNEITRSENHA